MLPGSSIGQRLVLTSFGESHGRSIGAVLDGCPAGLEIDEKEIQDMLNLRKPGQNIISTQRKEGDVVEIVSGVFRGFTTGAPITKENFQNLLLKYWLVFQLSYMVFLQLLL